jgi:hypothetical protein
LKTLTAIALAVVVGSGICFAQDAQVLDQVRKEVASLENGAGDVWEYSGGGGYIFRFSQDVLGDAAPESFVNVSVRPNVWHEFTGSEPKRYVGDAEVNGSGFLLHRNDEAATLLDTYQADALERYVIEQKITSTGIQKAARKVGEDATQEEYEAVLNRQLSDGTAWVTPKMEGILLHDLLNQPSPAWFEFDPDEAQVRNGYYRLPGDEARISTFENTFTPKVALEALNQKLGVSRPNEDDAASTSGSPVRSTATPAMSSPAGVKDSTPQPKTSPTPATVETESSSSFPILPVTIAVVVILGIVIYVLRRKSA